MMAIPSLSLGFFNELIFAGRAGDAYLALPFGYAQRVFAFGAAVIAVRLSIFDSVDFALDPVPKFIDYIHKNLVLSIPF
jgi:hypothetical protein